METEQRTPAGPLRQNVSDIVTDSRGTGETEFEKPRGINKVEIRPGLARAFISDLPQPLMDARLAILERVRNAGVSIDFLKFGNDAISFIAAEADHKQLVAALRDVNGTVEVEPGCCIVIVHAVNMQDEEGLVAKIVSQVIASGEDVDHVGDMHDRLLLVTDNKTGERLAKMLQSQIGGDQ